MADDTPIGKGSTTLDYLRARHEWLGVMIDETEAEIQRLKTAVAKLQRFKDWVHAYLDTAGVPHHPPGIHGAEGCRIGDRMDWLADRLRAAESNQLRLCGLLETIVKTVEQRADELDGKALYHPHVMLRALAQEFRQMMIGGGGNQ